MGAGFLPSEAVGGGIGAFTRFSASGLGCAGLGCAAALTGAADANDAAGVAVANGLSSSAEALAAPKTMGARARFLPPLSSPPPLPPPPAPPSAPPSSRRFSGSSPIFLARSAAARPNSLGCLGAAASGAASPAGAAAAAAAAVPLAAAPPSGALRLGGGGGACTTIGVENCGAGGARYMGRAGEPLGPEPGTRSGPDIFSRISARIRSSSLRPAPPSPAAPALPGDAALSPSPSLTSRPSSSEAPLRPSPLAGASWRNMQCAPRAQ